MSNRFLRAVLALYPRGFRRRYGPEVQGLVNDLEAGGRPLSVAPCEWAPGERGSGAASDGAAGGRSADDLHSRCCGCPGHGRGRGRYRRLRRRRRSRGRGATRGGHVERGRTRGYAGDGARGAYGATRGGHVERGRTRGYAGDGARRALAPPAAATSSAAGPSGTSATALAGPMAPPAAATSSAAGPAATPPRQSRGLWRHPRRARRAPKAELPLSDRAALSSPIANTPPPGSTIGADAWATPLDPPGNSAAGGWTIARVRPRRWARASLRSQRSRPSGR